MRYFVHWTKPSKQTTPPMFHILSYCCFYKTYVALYPIILVLCCNLLIYYTLVTIYDICTFLATYLHLMKTSRKNKNIPWFFHQAQLEREQTEGPERTEAKTLVPSKVRGRQKENATPNITTSTKLVTNMSIPMGSMGRKGIFTVLHEWLIFYGECIGRYTIHGSFGYVHGGPH